jgi:DNA polymerase elongation subunit (family B)
MSKHSEIYTYHWNVYEENGSTGIRIFGVNDNFETIFVLIPDFLPYIYIELSENITWNAISLRALSEALDYLTPDCKPLKREFRRNKKLYFANMNHDGTDKKTYPFLKCFFGTVTDIKKFSWKMKKPVFVPQVGHVSLKIHEMESNPILQFQCMQNIKPSSWSCFKGEKIINDNKESICTHEYIVNYINFLPLEKNTIAKPLILSFDCEVNSKNPNKAPSAGNPEDKVFQISCVSCRNGDPESKYIKCLLSLGKNQNGELIDLDQEILGEDVEYRMFDTEGDLLMGFTDYIYELNPQIICGYNIFRFDLPYMVERSKLTYTSSKFSQLSCLSGIQCKEKEIKWSSSAFKNQDFKYIDAPGRLWIDMYPIIQRDYKLDNYKLKTVSDHFLGQTKDDLSVQGIFKCYRLFTSKSLSIVGKYCVVDSLLVLKLFEKLQTWISLSEMSNICNVAIFTLFTQGQQIKIYSQVYKKCMAENIVIDKSSSESLISYNKFTGAYVFPPVPGVYDMVTSFDFSSLYPSIIIAYNICYSTLVLDDSISDDKCHIFSWHDHIGCGCPEDTNIGKKTKIKVENVVCEKRYFRFLKEPIGILPSLLKYLGDARNKAKSEMKKLTKLLPSLKEQEKEDTERMIVVYDKKQLAYKISSNSIYGSMGVKEGYLPFLPGAMSTTFKGRVSIEKAAKFLKENYYIKLIYGDTDSLYFKIPDFDTVDKVREMDNYCREIEEEVSAQFPSPMRFMYEEHIYQRYMILSKKRYVALTCNLDGIVDEKMTIRGILLNRRDNSKYVRDLYSKVIMNSFNKQQTEEIIYMITKELNNLCSNNVPYKDLIISKSVGSIPEYKIKALNEDDKKCIKRLKDLEIYDDEADLTKIRSILNKFIEKENPQDDFSLEYQIVKEYIEKGLPGQVQLAQKMRARGQRVDTGERLGYVIIEGRDGVKKISQKLEDAVYYKEHCSILKIDPLYYIHIMINPMDEVFNATLGLDNTFKKLYKYRENYLNVIREIKQVFSPQIEFVE